MESIIISNEVAWMGTLASPDDEWIELYNSWLILTRFTELALGGG